MYSKGIKNVLTDQRKRAGRHKYLMCKIHLKKIVNTKDWLIGKVFTTET